MIVPSNKSLRRVMSIKPLFSFVALNIILLCFVTIHTQFLFPVNEPQVINDRPIIGKIFILYPSFLIIIMFY